MLMKLIKNEKPTAMEQVINKPVKRRRASVSYGLGIELYHKKQKISIHVTVPFDDEKRNVVPSSLSSGKFKDTLWMLECSFFLKELQCGLGTIHFKLQKK